MLKRIAYASLLSWSLFSSFACRGTGADGESVRPGQPDLGAPNECRAPLAKWCEQHACSDYDSAKSALPAGFGGRCFEAWVGTCGTGHSIHSSPHGLDGFDAYYDAGGKLSLVFYMSDTNDLCQHTSFEETFGSGSPQCTPVKTQIICDPFADMAGAGQSCCGDMMVIPGG